MRYEMRCQALFILHFIAKQARNEVKLHNVPYLCRGLTTPDNVTRYRIVAIMSSSEATMTKMTREMAMTRHSYTVSSSSSPVPPVPCQPQHSLSVSSLMPILETDRDALLRVAQALVPGHEKSAQMPRMPNYRNIFRPSAKNIEKLVYINVSVMWQLFIVLAGLSPCVRLCAFSVPDVLCVHQVSDLLQRLWVALLRPALGHHRWRSVVFGFDVEISLADVFWWSTDIKFLKHICTLSGGRETKTLFRGPHLPTWRDRHKRTCPTWNLTRFLRQAITVL